VARYAKADIALEEPESGDGQLPQAAEA
jgi:hypothetical protein